MLVCLAFSMLKLTECDTKGQAGVCMFRNSLALMRSALNLFWMWVMKEGEVCTRWHSWCGGCRLLLFFSSLLFCTFFSFCGSRHFHHLKMLFWFTNVSFAHIFVSPQGFSFLSVFESLNLKCEAEKSIFF